MVPINLEVFVPGNSNASEILGIVFSNSSYCTGIDSAERAE